MAFRAVTDVPRYELLASLFLRAKLRWTQRYAGAFVVVVA